MSLFPSGQGQFTVYTFSKEGQKALGLNLKYLKLDKQRSCGLGTT